LRRRPPAAAPCQG